MADRYEVRAIGVVRGPFERKVDAPRQPRAAEDVEGRVELDPSLAHAVEDLDGFDHVWIVAWLDRADGYRPKVHPPRSETRRGVLATRSPHRPNPIALSVVRLVRVEGTTLHVRGLDLLDGTPVLDVKPYIPWADAIPDARAGWLEAERPEGFGGARPIDPRPAWEVVIGPVAADALAWLAARGIELEPTLRTVLATSPHPRPYRRIRADRERPGGFVIAIGEWRAAFDVEGQRVTVVEIRSGYRARERRDHPVHDAFDTRAVSATESGALPPVPSGSGLVERRLRLATEDVYVLGGVLAGEDHLASMHGVPGVPRADGRVTVAVVTTSSLAATLDAWLAGLRTEIRFEILAPFGEPSP